MPNLVAKPPLKSFNVFISGQNRSANAQFIVRDKNKLFRHGHTQNKKID